MDLLWQKDSKNCELYADIFKDVSRKDADTFSKKLSKTTAKMKALKFNQKNDKISLDCRQKGNVQFIADNWLEAMNLYNESLCYAEIGSENLGLAYANRSACFMELKKYNECLVDIELAKQANYPLRLMPKLDKRREDCLRLKDADKNGKKLSYEADEKFPGMANVLEIRCDKKFGRHIIAKCDIPAGKIVLAEKSFIARVLSMRFNSCSVCMKILMNLIPCTQCTGALFCNSECANVNDIHKTDCADIIYNGDGPLQYYICALVFIISIFTNVECLIEFVENAIKNEKVTAPHSLDDVESRFRALLQLSKNNCPTEMKSDERLSESLMIYNTVLQRKSFNMLFETEQKKRFLMHLVLHLNCVMINNGFTARMADNEVSGLKMSVYIISSYFNHSCAPNLLGSNTVENVRHCRTVRPIKAGQQLFISYLNDFSAQPDHNSLNEIDLQNRQKILYENFGFRCKCERCVPNMRFRQMNSRNMRSDPIFQWLYKSFDSFLNNGFGSKEEKAAVVEKKIVDILNRFGDKHWCDELASIIATYETFY